MTIAGTVSTAIAERIARAKRHITAHAPRFARFGLIGASGALVNSAVLYVLVSRLTWSPLAAAVIATEAAIVSNFLLNDRWTFRDARGESALRLRLLRFNSVAGGGMMISLAALALLTRGLGVNYLLANLFAIGAATLWNYAANTRVTRTSRGHSAICLEELQT
jgi:dolichol-phosphate mannosyltransferase